jgi:hypothetical protein
MHGDMSGPGVIYRRGAGGSTEGDHKAQGQQSAHRGCSILLDVRLAPAGINVASFTIDQLGGIMPPASFRK